MILQCIFLAIFSRTFATDSSVKKGLFCQAEKLKIGCPKGTVIIVERARYGRFPQYHENEKCIGKTNVPCTSDERYRVDILKKITVTCTGNRTCENFVSYFTEGVKGGGPCGVGYSHVLYVWWRCVREQNEKCGAEKVGHLEVPGYLVFGKSNNQHNACKKWIIEAHSKKINFTLYTGFEPKFDRDSCITFMKFSEAHSKSVVSRKEAEQVRLCQNDVDKPDRYPIWSNIYKSDSNRVEVELEKDSKFIVRFTSYGCGKLKAPDGVWVQYGVGGDDDSAQAGCDREQKSPRWFLMCSKEGEWSGEIGKCVDTPDTLESKLHDIFDSLPDGIWISIILGAAIVISAIILTIGLVCLKRQKLQMPNGVYADGQVYYEAAPKAGGQNAEQYNRSQGSGSVENEYSCVHDAIPPGSTYCTPRDSIAPKQGYYAMQHRPYYGPPRRVSTHFQPDYDSAAPQYFELDPNLVQSGTTSRSTCPACQTGTLPTRPRTKHRKNSTGRKSARPASPIPPEAVGDGTGADLSQSSSA